MPAPFGPESRTGFELELLAPRGRTRLDLAAAIAERTGARLEHGLKYYAEGETFAGGRPVCRLTAAVRVMVGEAPLCTLVDDNTIRDDLDPAADRGEVVALMDDVRLAKLAEARSWSPLPGVAASLANLGALFGGGFADPDDLVDRYGHPLAKLQPLAGERARVCEIVTAPLTREERRPVIEQLLGAARELRVTVPKEAALHLHLDGEPWRATGPLRALVLAYANERERLLAEWRPNPACRKLGPLPAEVTRVAAEATDDLPFPVFAAALKLAGAQKGLDLNLLGLIERFPLQPTLEVRALPMSLDPAEVLAKVAAVEAFLARTHPG